MLHKCFIVANRKHSDRKTPYEHEEFLVQGTCISQQTLEKSDELDTRFFWFWQFPSYQSTVAVGSTNFDQTPGYKKIPHVNR